MLLLLVPGVPWESRRRKDSDVSKCGSFLMVESKFQLRDWSWHIQYIHTAFGLTVAALFLEQLALGSTWPENAIESDWFLQIPLNLTCSLERDDFKRKVAFQPSSLRGYVSVWGSKHVESFWTFKFMEIAHWRRYWGRYPVSCDLKVVKPP